MFKSKYQKEALFTLREGGEQSKHSRYIYVLPQIGKIRALAVEHGLNYECGCIYDDAMHFLFILYTRK